PADDGDLFAAFRGWRRTGLATQIPRSIGTPTKTAPAAVDRRRGLWVTAMTNNPTHDEGEQRTAPHGADKPAADFPPGDTVDIAALSHRGNVRPHNEDVYLLLRAG